MCNCIMIGNVKIIDGLVFIGDREIKDIPFDLLCKMRKDDFKCTIKDGRVFIEEYELVGDKFKKTLRAWLMHKF